MLVRRAERAGAEGKHAPRKVERLGNSLKILKLSCRSLPSDSLLEFQALITGPSPRCNVHRERERLRSNRQIELDRLRCESRHKVISTTVESSPIHAMTARRVSRDVAGQRNPCVELFSKPFDLVRNKIGERSRRRSGRRVGEGNERRYADPARQSSSRGEGDEQNFLEIGE